MQAQNVGEIARKWYKTLSFPEEYDPLFTQLTETVGDLEECRFVDYDLERNKLQAEKNLIMFLYFCQELSQRYTEAGIPEKILIATLQTLPGKAGQYYHATGVLGLSGIRWIAPIFRMEQFRLGRMVFCMAGLPVDVPEKGLRAGDPVVDIHIPAGEPLTQTACDAAFDLAEKFFGKFFPGYEFSYYMCFSWLLDAGLRQFLNEDANILRFQKRFEPVHARQMDSILHFMFKYGISDREELRTLPANTDFARKVKEYALTGGVFWNVLGLCERKKQ